MAIFCLFIAAILLSLSAVCTLLVLVGIRTLFIRRGDTEFYVCLVLLVLCAMGFGLGSYAFIDLSQSIGG